MTHTNMTRGQLEKVNDRIDDANRTFWSLDMYSAFGIKELSEVLQVALYHALMAEYYATDWDPATDDCITMDDLL